MSSIYAMQESVLNLYNELESVNNWLSDNAGNPEVKIEEIRAKQARRDELKERHDIAAAALEAAKAQQRAQMERKPAPAADPKADQVKATAQFYRAALRRDQPAIREAMAKLGAVPTGDSTLGYGENLLPTNLSRTLIHEPFDTNPMRGIIRITSITGLEVPKIAYTIDDDAFVNDKTNAKEMDLTASKVSFGRHKTKIYTAVSDTMMLSEDVGLVQYINNALASGLASKEKKVMFAASPASGEETMSFYSTQNALKKIEAATMYDAIVGALSDLNDQFLGNAKLVMKRGDYLAMIKELANQSATLWGAKPEDVLGVPVVFCDAATTPILGDFNFAQLNYDPNTTFDSDKEILSGDSRFVLTAWFDFKILLSSAFRLCGIEAGG